MFVNIINSYRYVVAICDENLIGKIFEEGKRQLNVKENFYKGEIKSPEKTKEIIKKMFIEDATFNIVGKESIKIALEEKIITQEGIFELQGIPYSMILL
jgi:uncharacterized protein